MSSNLQIKGTIETSKMNDNNFKYCDILATKNYN